MDLIGIQLGKYRIVEQIGGGGMAEVYKAYQPDLDRYVAVKVIAPDLSHDPEFLAQFEREARLLARLEHPNILPIYDSGDFDGRPYLVMQYQRGGTLADCLGRPQPVDEVVRIVSQIGDALAYAHAKGIVHRDVKPANVLLTESGRVLLTDFGIATPMNAAGRDSGTRGYVPPEQRDGKPIDGRADIFALGVILYELLTGARFGQQNIITRSLSISHVPPPLATVITCSANWKIVNRYELAEDFVAALQDARHKILPNTIDTPTSSQLALEVAVIVVFALAGLGLILYGTTLSNPSDRIVAMGLGVSCWPASAMFALRNRSRPLTTKLINAVLLVTMGLALLVFSFGVLSTAFGLALLLPFSLPSLLMISVGAWQYARDQRRARARQIPRVTKRRAPAHPMEIRQTRNAIVNTIVVLVGVQAIGVVIGQLTPKNSWLNSLSQMFSGGLVISALVLGLGLAVWYIYSMVTATVPSAEAAAQQVTTNLKARQDRLDKARAYQQRVQAAITHTREGLLRDRLRTATSRLSEWIAYLERLTTRLNEFDRDPVIQRDRSTVPRAVDRLETRLALEQDTDENIVAAARQTLAARQLQLGYLHDLELVMSRAELYSEQTVAELGTIYSQVLLVDAKDIQGSRARRVQTDIDEQIQALHDLLAALDEVRSQRPEPLMQSIDYPGSRITQLAAPPPA